MFTTEMRMQKILTANPKVLARIDAVLSGEDSTSGKQDVDTRTVTFVEAARRLGVSRPTIYRLTRAKRLHTVELSGVRRILLSSIVDFVNK